jgi:hypothetical protein
MEKLLTPSEVADALCIKPDTLRIWRRRGMVQSAATSADCAATGNPRLWPTLTKRNVAARIQTPGKAWQQGFRNGFQRAECQTLPKMLPGVGKNIFPPIELGILGASAEVSINRSAWIETPEYECNSTEYVVRVPGHPLQNRPETWFTPWR